MLAVIKTGGKQYVIAPGQKLKIEKIDVQEGDVFVFDQVLLIADSEKFEVGMPMLKDAKVEAKVIKQGRAPKLIILKYHSKTRHRKKIGHRQPFTEVEIIKVTS
ncbi:MAG: 50S ribosomal protein L21 [bacterium]|nr:50S ribosomal protein L21 [bacterium]